MPNAALPPIFPEEGPLPVPGGWQNPLAVAQTGGVPGASGSGLPSGVTSTQLVRSLAEVFQQQLAADRWAEVLERLEQLQVGINELNQQLRGVSGPGVLNSTVAYSPAPHSRSAYWPQEPLAGETWATAQVAGAAAPAEAALGRAAPTTAVELIAGRRVFGLIYANARDPAIGAGCQINASFLESLLKSTCDTSLASSQTRFDFTQASIAADVKQQEAGPNDVLFVYIATHGVFANGTRHMLLSTRSAGGVADIDRKGLFESLRKSKAGLKVLISDACGSVSGARAAAAVVRGTRTPTFPLFTLLFSTTGEVNVNAARSPEYALYISQNTVNGGGIFTRTFCDEAVYGTPPASAALTEWDRFFNGVGRKANQVVMNNVGLPNGTVANLRQPYPCKFDSQGREIPYPVS